VCISESGEDWGRGGCLRPIKVEARRPRAEPPVTKVFTFQSLVWRYPDGQRVLCIVGGVARVESVMCAIVTLVNPCFMSPCPMSLEALMLAPWYPWPCRFPALYVYIDVVCVWRLPCR